MYHQACNIILDILYFCLIIEDLQKQLLEQVELRKKLEREFQSLKGKQQQCFTTLMMTCMFSQRA